MVEHPVQDDANAAFREIGAKAVPRILVFNKIDRLQDRAVIPYLADKYPNPVFVSAWRGINMAGLRDQVIALLEGSLEEQEVVLSQQQYKLLSHIHDTADILEKRYSGNRITVRFRAPKAEAERIMKLAGPGPARRKGKAPHG